MIIAIIAIIFFFYAALCYLELGAVAATVEFSTIFSFMAGWGTLDFILAGAISLAVAFLIDADGAKGVLGSVTDAVSDAAKGVLGVVTGVTSSLANTVLSSPLVWLVAGVATIVVLRKD